MNALETVATRENVTFLIAEEYRYFTCRVEVRSSGYAFSPELGRVIPSRVPAFEVLELAKLYFPTRRLSKPYEFVYLLPKGDWNAVYRMLRFGVAKLREAGEVVCVTSVSAMAEMERVVVDFSVDVTDGGASLEVSTSCDDLNDLDFDRCVEAAASGYPMCKSGVADLYFDLTSDSVQAIRVFDGCPNSKKSGVGRRSVPARYSAFVRHLLETCCAEGAVSVSDAAKSMLYPNAAGDAPNLALLRQDLLPHQVEAVEWMWRRSCCPDPWGAVFDDLGVGKTVEALALVCARIAKNGRGSKSLVVCPASVVPSWVDHFRRFAPEVACIEVKGGRADRVGSLKAGFWQVAVTSYGRMKADLPIYAKLGIDTLILDEAHAAKNPSSKTHQAIKGLAPHCSCRFALTGTPVPNNLMELHAIFSACLDTGYLGSAAGFQASFVKPIENGDFAAAEGLRGLISHCMIRRLSDDVLTGLPDLREHRVEIRLPPEQAGVYNAIADDARKRLAEMEDEDLTATARMGILARITRLRQACVNPRSIEGLSKSYEGPAEKLDWAVKMARSHVARGDKVVLFTLFVTGVVGELSERLAAVGLKSHILVGSTPVEERSAIVDSFQYDDIPILIMGRAGSEGINLQRAANVMIDLTPWWNFDQNYQAARRIYRIGQQQDVDVYRLVVEGSIENRMVDLQDSKRRTADLVVRQPRLDINKMTRAELVALLAPIS